MSMQDFPTFYACYNNYFMTLCDSSRKIMAYADALQ